MSRSAPQLHCWNCGISLAQLPLPLSRHEHCPKCFEALHCCRLCRHFRAGETITCAEDRADPPTIKENANFCDWFQPRHGTAVQSGSSRSSNAKARLDALFDDPEDLPPDAESSADTADKSALAKAKLDALFGNHDKS